MAEPLASWNDGAAKAALLEFVERVSADGVPPSERVAVFDNDGTLWCEKPMPIQADFILRRLHEMAEADPALREKQPWKAAYERDYAWLGQVMVEHYAGDDTNVRTLLGGVIAAHAGISVDEFEEQADTFLRSAQHPTLGRGYVECAYAPMVELLRYLDANGFSNYIASGGGRDFMRPLSEEMYGIPPRPGDRQFDRARLPADDDGGSIMRKPEADVLDDGPEKPVRIWSRIGRRPILAAGNSNGDIPMLDFTQHADKPTLRLLVLHDDAEREFAYTAGAERALDRAEADRTGRWSASRTTGRPSSRDHVCGEPPRSTPLPQATARPHRLQHIESEPHLDIGATLAHGGRQGEPIRLVERDDFSERHLFGAFHDEKPLAHFGKLLSQPVGNQRADGRGSGRIRGGLPFLEVNHHAEMRLGRVIGVKVVRQDRGRHVARPDRRASQTTAFFSP